MSSRDIPITYFHFAMMLTRLVAFVEVTAWLELSPFSLSLRKAFFSTGEMVLIMALLWNGWGVRAWLKENVRQPKGKDGVVLRVANYTFASLALCSLGDLINRNYMNLSYSYDGVVEHSYLADSVWFFFPGYALFIYAAWEATPQCRSFLTLVLASVAGAVSFGTMVYPGTSPYVFVLTGSYSMLITGMVPVGLWVYRRKLPGGNYVALGAVLATIADAIIGQFWLYCPKESQWYPGVAYLNFVIYFFSQALIQQLPLALYAAE